MRRLRWLIALGGLIASPAFAITITAAVPGGTTLAAAQAGTGRSATAVDTTTGGYQLVVTYCVAGGTATVKTQVSFDRGTTWVDVANSTKSIDSAGTVCDSVSILAPQAVYATNVTVQTGTVTTKAFFAARQQ